jgi:hypothetical protein
MTETSASNEVLKYVTGVEIPQPGEALSRLFKSPVKQLTNEEAAAMTAEHQARDQEKLTLTRADLQEEIRRREEAEAWEMYSRSYSEQHPGKAPAGRDTEHGKAQFTTYQEQTYKPYKAAMKKAIRAANEGNNKDWIKHSNEAYKTENSRAYQDRQTHMFNKARGESERDRYGDYLSRVVAEGWRNHDAKAQTNATRTIQAPARGEGSRAAAPTARAETRSSAGRPSEGSSTKSSATRSENTSGSTAGGKR